MLAGVNASNLSRKQFDSSAILDAWRAGDRPCDLLCLNAAPRVHRIAALLELANQNLITFNENSKPLDQRSSLVSMSSLDYVKTPIDKASLSDYVSKRHPHLSVLLESLLSALPLHVDNHQEKGNQLAAKISIEPYLISRLAFCNETGIGSEAKRVTEKALKPLALGLPVVIYGHKNSLDVVRTMVFSVFDDFIDNSYDIEEDNSVRLKHAARSARAFLESLNNKSINADHFLEHVNHNITWSSRYFFDFYWGCYIEPVLCALGIN